MRIYRIDHIATVTPDLERQVGLLEGLFGFRRLSTWDNRAQGVRGVRFAVPGSSGQVWEVLAPSGDNSPIQAALDDNGGRAGFHHVAVEVPDLDAAVRELDELGITTTTQSGWVEASLTPPKSGKGVLFRLRGPGSLALCGDEAAVPAERTEPDGPTLGILNVDHVCQAFPDRDELAAWYAALAGFVQVWRTPIDEHPDMADLVLNIPGSSICWEIIMPRGDDSFIDRFLSRNGPAVHHVTFQVSDWDAALAACAHHEIPTFDDETGVTDGAAWKHTFIHPKHAGGVLVQLFWEERPGVWVRSDKIPPES
ncbi:VOC family protein [Amycolatopsis taiwanensis]|uniref:VOC family protein n=1 Tax=Amycolatopsis taiwanensis TaxID=342230 RepID=UPI0004879FA0|nr:VOC family protein [Amycolatopsis taiwanensis]